MDRSLSRGSVLDKGVRWTGWGVAMVLAAVLMLGSVDRNAASSHERSSNKAESVMRASEAPAVAAQADSEDSQRVPGHPELDLQLD